MTLNQSGTTLRTYHDGKLTSTGTGLAAGSKFDDGLIKFGINRADTQEFPMTMILAAISRDVWTAERFAELYADPFAMLRRQSITRKFVAAVGGGGDGTDMPWTMFDNPVVSPVEVVGY